MLATPKPEKDPMSELKTLLLPIMEGFSEWRNVKGMQEIDAQSMPQPYRQLLAHQRDMTGTLSQFFGQELRLDVLEKQYRPPILARRVLLRLKSDQKAVEYGAIRIHLEHYPESSQERILQGQEPLGAILNDLQIPYLSQPQRFIKIQETRFLSQYFDGSEADVLYGRCNILSTPDGKILAEIVEVLPPISQQ